MRRSLFLLCALLSFALILSAQEKAEEKPAKGPTGPSEILKLDPNNETAHLQLANSDFEHKRYAGALEHSRAVIRILEKKQQPSNMSGATWAKHLKEYRGAAHSIAAQRKREAGFLEPPLPNVNHAMQSELREQELSFMDE